MKARLEKLVRGFGALGAFAVALIVAAALFRVAAVDPLRAENQALAARLRSEAMRAGRSAPDAAARTTAEKVAAVYRFLDRKEATTDWLAKLHGIGAATGVVLRSADYRQKTEGRVVRFEITLPVAGSYAQIRDFLRRSLADIPVLSLDQLTLKRASASDARLQAELRLTLHTLKSGG